MSHIRPERIRLFTCIVAAMALIAVLLLSVGGYYLWRISQLAIHETLLSTVVLSETPSPANSTELTSRLSTLTPTPSPSFTPSPSPTPTPKVWTTEPTGSIVFTCFIDEIVDQLCTINADGSGYSQITDSWATDWYASYAPDGERIIFSSRRDDRFELYEMNPDGTSLIRLTNDLGSGLYAPSISPDGTQIIFANEREGSQSIWIMNRDGSNPHPLTNTLYEDLDPVWSPDGSLIAFASNRAGTRQSFVMNADGSELRQITNLPNMGGRISWSPDGEMLAFYAGESLHRHAYTIRVDGTDLNRLTTDSNNTAPCFSPDGQWIVFASYRDGDLELYLIRPDGTDLRQLTFNTYSDWQPRWSP